MKKIFRTMFLIFIVVAVIFVICGCDKTDTTPDTDSSNTETPQKVYMGFDYIGGSSHFDFYKEISTDVIYIYSYEQHGYGGGASMTVMLDPETGFPLTYTKWIEKYQYKE